RIGLLYQFDGTIDISASGRVEGRIGQEAQLADLNEGCRSANMGDTYRMSAHLIHDFSPHVGSSVTNSSQIETFLLMSFWIRIFLAMETASYVPSLIFLIPFTTTIVSFLQRGMLVCQSKQASTLNVSKSPDKFSACLP